MLLLPPRIRLALFSFFLLFPFPFPFSRRGPLFISDQTGHPHPPTPCLAPAPPGHCPCKIVLALKAASGEGNPAEISNRPPKNELPSCRSPHRHPPRHFFDGYLLSVPTLLCFAHFSTCWSSYRGLVIYIEDAEGKNDLHTASNSNNDQAN